jgi:hypothetical protein
MQARRGLRRRDFGLLTLAAALVLFSPAAARQTTVPELPSRLSDQAFWQIIADTSEPDGLFQSDNLVGNERPLQDVIPALRHLPRGGVYLGVAPDQNFTYIVALEPRIAFIVDIRRENLLEHLMYKALIEMSATRSEFVARLFSYPAVADVAWDGSAASLFEAYRPAVGAPEVFQDNLRAIVNQLVHVHGFPLSAGDLDSIRTIYAAFFRFGPSLTYASNKGGGGGRSMPTYAEMQLATDLDGKAWGYLSSEARYQSLRTFEGRNLIVPIVGDFAGPKALRAIGTYLAAHDATVTAFYVSNVELYLFRNAVSAAFYQNVETLPIDDRSVFIRSLSGRNVVDPIGGLLKDFEAGHISGYVDVMSRGTVREQ